MKKTRGKGAGRRLRMRMSLTLALLLIVVALAAAMLSGCGKKDVELTMGQTTEIEQYLTFTPVNILVRADQIFAPKGTEDGWVYNGSLKEPVYVALVAKVKNLTGETLKTTKLAQGTLKQGEQEYPGSECMLLTGDATRLERNGEIRPQQEAVLYILMNGEAATRGKEAQIRLTFTSSAYDGEETYTLACDTAKDVAVAIPLKKGKKVTAEGCGELTLTGAQISDRIDPPQAASTKAYTYYTPKTEKELLLDIPLTVKNRQKKDCQAETFAGVMAACAGKICDGFFVTETDHGRDFQEKATIGAGAESRIHAMVNVPEDWQDKDITVYLYLDGQEYAYTYPGKEQTESKK